MNRSPYFVLFFGLIIFASCNTNQHDTEDITFDNLKKHEPSDNFFLQRTYPEFRFDMDQYDQSLRKVMENEQSFERGATGTDHQWTTQGPGNIGARINTIAIHPDNDNIIYAGFSRGGVWKTEDGGENWKPIFDEQLYLTVGDIAIDPQNPETIYVGTGDPNISGYPAIGDGLYRSENAGKSWEYIGLVDTRIISKIIINPLNNSEIYVSTMGLPFERNTDRGLYKTTDYGNTWEQILFVGDDTGICDILMDPENPLKIYAASWTRIRNNTESLVSGEKSRIHISEDGGQTWEEFQLASDITSRIGLSMSAQNSNKIVAVIIGTNYEVESIQLSMNGGQTWSHIAASGENGLGNNALGGFGWYFGKIRINPVNDAEWYILGVNLWRSQDNGKNWESIGPPWWEFSVHADKHDLAFGQDGLLYLATDGGLYSYEPVSDAWKDIENIPTTQFYRVAYNPNEPDLYYGGAQDNGTSGGSKEDINNWIRIYGADGFQATFHPTNPDIFYCETQRGGLAITVDGGKTWRGATNGIKGGDRGNWDLPYIMSPHDPQTLYYGTHRLYKSKTDTIPFFNPISEDLTDGNVFGSAFHTISAVVESAIQPGFIFVGTSDGNLWRTLDDGQSWDPIHSSLPDRYVTSVKTSPTNMERVYVTMSGYKDNDQENYVYRSNDLGENWTNIASDLPTIPINDVYIIPGHQDSVIFVATDAGVYVSKNEGENWDRLGSNMPLIHIYDLEFNPVRNELIAGTFARSIMTYEIDSLFYVPDTVNTSVSNLKPSIHKLEIWPSLANHSIMINSTIDLQDATYQIIDANGNIVMQGKHTNKLVNVSQLIEGHYFIVLSKEDKQHRHLGRFIKTGHL